MRFLEDVWVGNSSLETSFQRLFSLSANQEQKVEEVGVWEGPEWQWRLQWRRNKFEWEFEMVINLLQCITRAYVKRYISDIQVWGGGGTREVYGEFSIHMSSKEIEWDTAGCF